MSSKVGFSLGGMTVLCDWEIRARCEKSEMVVPFEPELLNPASLDVRLGDFLMVESIYSPDLIKIDISDKTEDDPFMLQSGEFCLAETRELFNLPNDISCQFVPSQAVQEMVLITCLLAGAIQAGTEASLRSN